MVGTIYMKTLRLTSVAAREVGQGAATTLMSVDVEKVSVALEFVHEICELQVPAGQGTTLADLFIRAGAGILAIILAFVLLWFKASWAMFAPLVMILLIFSVTTVMSGPVGRAQGTWMARLDARIKLLVRVSPA